MSRRAQLHSDQRCTGGPHHAGLAWLLVSLALGCSSEPAAPGAGGARSGAITGDVWRFGGDTATDTTDTSGDTGDTSGDSNTDTTRQDADLHDAAVQDATEDVAACPGGSG